MNKFYKLILSIILFLISFAFIYYKTDCAIGDLELETISYEDYLYSRKWPWYILRVNKFGNVTYRGKVVLCKNNVLCPDENTPLNIHTAYTYLELKTLFVAERVKPKKGCNPNKPGNGIYGLGCYIDNH